MENHGLGAYKDKIYAKSSTECTTNTSKFIQPICPNRWIIWDIFEKKPSSHVHCPCSPFMTNLLLHTSKMIKCKDVISLKIIDDLIFLYSNWAGLISEMELVPCYHPGVTCNGCGLGPIAGSRFKCKQCNDFDFCERCFHTKRSHKHTFNRIAEPSSAAVFAGRPGRRRHRSSGTVIQNQ